MDNFPGNRHSETEKIQHFTKDVNFLKMLIAHGSRKSCHYQTIAFYIHGKKDYQATGMQASQGLSPLKYVVTVKDSGAWPLLCNFTGNRVHSLDVLQANS